MHPTAAEVLHDAMALSPDERRAVAETLLHSTRSEENARLETLRKDVASGFEQIDRGEGIDVPGDQLRDYLRGLGRTATERVAHRKR